MTMRKIFLMGVAAIGIAALGLIAPALLQAQQTAAVAIDGDDIGGVTAMGCTVGQAITGISTLAIGSILTFLAIVIGAAGTMKYQYWRIEKGA